MIPRKYSLLSSLALLCLSGCSAVEDKSVSLSAIYAVTALFSLCLLCLYWRIAPRRSPYYLLLFLCVPIINIGYFLLASSPDLTSALWANRLSYLGSVFLPLSMLMILLEAAHVQPPRWLPVALWVIAAGVFLLAASPGWLDVYYREVTWDRVNGVSLLHKVYGPLHGLYMVYLVGYFVSMIAVISYAVLRRRVSSALEGIILAICVFVNLAVWLLEQLTSIDFEFLSVSYIITELFLLCLLSILRETERLHSLAAPAPAPAPTPIPSPDAACDPARMDTFEQGLQELTPAERGLYQLYLQGLSTQEILSELHITANTLKYHNRNLYSKLGVSSRKELIRLARTLQDKPSGE